MGRASPWPGLLRQGHWQFQAASSWISDSPWPQPSSCRGAGAEKRTISRKLGCAGSHCRQPVPLGQRGALALNGYWWDSRPGCQLRIVLPKSSSPDHLEQAMTGGTFTFRGENRRPKCPKLADTAPQPASHCSLLITLKEAWPSPISVSWDAEAGRGRSLPKVNRGSAC